MKATTTGTGQGISPVFVVLLVVGVILAIALVTHGVPWTVGLPLALVGALAIDWALFGRGR